MFSNKGKLFLVLAISFLVVAKAQAISPSYSIVGLEDGPEEVLVTDSLFPEANLGPGFHSAYKFNVYGGDENNLGYVTTVGGSHNVHFETLNYTLGCCPAVNAALQTYNGSSNSFTAFSPSYSDGWYDSIDVLEMIYGMGVNNYSFIGYLLAGSNSFPAIDASWYVIPTSPDSFVSVLDLNTPDSRNWIVDVTIGELTSPVPEPATYVMFLLGMMLLWLFSGRRVIKHDPGGAIV